jgi:hypothetical protein
MLQAIGRVQMGMDANDLGDSASVEDSADSTDWSKKATNEVAFLWDLAHLTLHAP